jgi:hypothetical protein
MANAKADNDEDVELVEGPMTLDRFVRDNPITSVVGALIIGLLLGRIGLL